MTVSIDPNLRTLLVPVASYRLWIDRWAGLADIVRLSEDDLDQLWPGWTPEQAAVHLHACGVPLAVVSLGGAGAFASLRGAAGPGADRADHAGRHRRAPAIRSMAACCTTWPRAAISAAGWTALTVEGLTAALTFASRVSAITCSRAGANPPWAAELVGLIGRTR